MLKDFGGYGVRLSHLAFLSYKPGFKNGYLLTNPCKYPPLGLGLKCQDIVDMILCQDIIDNKISTCVFRPRGSRCLPLTIQGGRHGKQAGRGSPTSHRAVSPSRKPLDHLHLDGLFAPMVVQVVAPRWWKGRNAKACSPCQES